MAHVEALELARIDELPAGPYVGAYYRLVSGVVGGAEDEDEAEFLPPDPGRALPVWVARGLAFASLLLLGALVVWQLANGGLTGAVDVAEGIVAGTPAPPPEQVVELTAERQAEFHVIVDGETALNGTLARGMSRTFVGRRRVEIVVSGAGDATLRYNGRRIVPQGRQQTARTLIFEDDNTAAP